MPVLCLEDSHNGHVSPYATVPLATVVIGDMHVPISPVIVHVVTGPDSRVFVQRPLEEGLELFCGGVSKEGLGAFIDIGADSYRRLLVHQPYLESPT